MLAVSVGQLSCTVTKYLRSSVYLKEESRRKMMMILIMIMMIDFSS